MREEQGRRCSRCTSQPLIGLGKADWAVGFDQADKHPRELDSLVGVCLAHRPHHVGFAKADKALSAWARPTGPCRHPRNRVRNISAIV